jgi:hypothetical protein
MVITQGQRDAALLGIYTALIIFAYSEFISIFCFCA